MALSELIERVGGTGRGLEGAGPAIERATLDSREVGTGSLFAALAGIRGHGLDYAEAAREAGAAALLVGVEDADRARASGLPVWTHEDPRAAFGYAAAVLAGDPTRGVPTIAVTGTNGKTTVAWMAAELMRAAGSRPALFGTVGYFVEGRVPLPSTHTTPDAARLQELFALHRAAGGDALVLEASSHALDQRRLSGVEVDVAVFTNLTRDHLDYHGDMEAYRAAKARLFQALPVGGAAVLPATGEAAEEFARIAEARGARVLRYGIASSGDRGRSQPDLYAAAPEVTPEGLSVTITGALLAGRSTSLSIRGRHNVENLLAAMAATLATGADPSLFEAELAPLSLPPGRMEQVTPPGHPFHCLVDYAHTPDALEVVLRALREELVAAGRGRLVCVFGCGGDRDRGKRAPMGRVVAELSDLAIVTSDNPRTEDPAAIVDAVLEGCRGASAEVLVEVDRRRAIELALSAARPGDRVLVAGKGHESEQILADRRIRFDDREVLREVLG
jgi:UDP-N-acetylmuramoyl-L-alanyl-D-glutamate--2,6-diaminopimelate ligase